MAIRRGEGHTIRRTGEGIDSLKKRYRSSKPEKKKTSELRPRLHAGPGTVPAARMMKRQPTCRLLPLTQCPQSPLFSSSPYPTPKLRQKPLVATKAKLSTRSLAPNLESVVVLV